MTPTYHLLYPTKDEHKQLTAVRCDSRNALQRLLRTGSVRIPPLYRDLLTVLYSVGYLRSDQMVKMLRILAAQKPETIAEKSLVRVVQKRCLAFTRAGLVRRIKPPVFPDLRSGPPFYIYTLDRGGAALVAEQLGLPLRELAWRSAGDESQLFLNHTLQTVDLRIMLAEACLRHQLKLAEWIDDRLLRREPVRVSLAGEDGATLRVSIIPDAYYRLKLASGPTLACCLEVDLGTSTIAPSKWHARSFRRKVLAYRHLMKGGDSNGLWNAKGIVVTTVTTSLSRVAHLKRVCENAGGDERFWFATFDSLQADTILTAPVWSVAGKGDQRFSLLPEG